MGECGDCLGSCIQMTWFCGESEEDLRVTVGQFAQVCRRRGLKDNAGKSKVMILNGEERLKCEVHVDRIHLEHISEFKYLGCVLGEAGTDGAESSRKVTSGKRVASAVRSLVNGRDLQFEYARLLHEKLLVSALMYGSETMLWKGEGEI